MCLHLKFSSDFAIYVKFKGRQSLTVLTGVDIQFSTVTVSLITGLTLPAAPLSRPARHHVVPALSGLHQPSVHCLATGLGTVIVSQLSLVQIYQCLALIGREVHNTLMP